MSRASRHTSDQWRNAIVRYADEDPASLLANPQNWRLHPKEQTAALTGSLNELGWIAPVIVNETTQHVVDGHARIGEAIARGEPSVPVAYVRLTEEQERLALATFDPIAAMAATDQAMLDDLLSGLTISDGGLDDLLKSLASEQPKALHEDDTDLTPPAEPITKPGDLWLLGDHRLLCGDSTKAEDVARLMDGERAGAVVTDPPYGIDRQGITGDGIAGLARLYADTIMQIPSDSAIVIAFQSPRLFPVWLDAIRDAGQHFERALWFYDETDMTFPWRGWLMTSQIALVSSMGSPNWPEPNQYHHDCYVVKTAGMQDAAESHTAAKPLDVVFELVGHTAGDVYEPFAGSGTTLIAAEQLGRRCYGMEIDPAYCDVIVRRWEHLTGRQAERA